MRMSPAVRIVGAAAAVAIGGAVAACGERASDPAGRWVQPVTAGSPSTPSAAPSAASDTVTLSATGDIIMGAAPGALPPADGRGFFAGVGDALRSDVQMGNLEEPLTNDTGVTKCPKPSAAPSPAPSPSPTGKQDCFAFRSPPGYATVLHDAGFAVMNLANNHAYDFGADGNRQTRAALDAAGVRHTGAPGQITVVDAKGVRVAVLGFAPYSYAQSLLDLDGAAAIVRRAKAQADIVVVQMHVGAEGAEHTHIKPGTEMFLGENRGDSMKFAHTVVEAGADLVVGHGPHVMRAMEFYRGHLIAYSMGNFAGYRTLSAVGVTGVGGILRVSLHRDGGFAAARLVATRMVAPGLPAMDPTGQAPTLVRSLCDADLPATGVRVAADGTLTPR
jgi:hypothetical protein